MRRFPFVLAAICLVPLGVYTKLYEGPGQSWVVGYAGGIVYVVFWVLFVLALIPRLAPARVCVAVVVVTSVLEVLQLWHPPLLEAIRRTFVGHGLLGSTFAWQDFIHYGIGGFVAFFAARRLSANRTRPAGV